MPRTPARELADEEVLSQFGCREDVGPVEPPFRNRPRAWNQEPGISVIVGELTPQEAAAVVRRHGICLPRDGVRHTTVGTLRRAGFVVFHTPNVSNPAHATVSYPPPWGHTEDERFDDCFGREIWADEEDGSPRE